MQISGLPDTGTDRAIRRNCSKTPGGAGHTGTAAVSAIGFQSTCCLADVLVGLDGCEVRLCVPCARVRPCVPCVFTFTYTHSHTHSWRVTRGGGKEYGSCVR